MKQRVCMVDAAGGQEVGRWVLFNTPRQGDHLVLPDGREFTVNAVEPIMARNLDLLMRVTPSPPKPALGERPTQVQGAQAEPPLATIGIHASVFAPASFNPYERQVVEAAMLQAGTQAVQTLQLASQQDGPLTLAIPPFPTR